MSAKVDPRVAKRRAQVAADRRRRRRRRLAIAGGVAIAVAGVVGVFRSPLLDVDRVDITGAQHTSVAAVRATTGLGGAGHPMIAVDRFALARRIERLPWVARAEVTRKWPNVVRVKVVERVPVGAIGVPGGVALVDVEGRVLATATAPPEHTYPVTVAPGDRIPPPGNDVPAAVRGALRIAGALPAGLAAQVEAVHRVPGSPATYELALHGAVTIRMGDDSRIADKLAAAEAVLAAQHSPGTVIDVRVPRSPAVSHAQNGPAPTSTTRKP